MFNKLSAEFLGTFWLVFGGCGTAVLSAAFPDLGVGFLGVALAFGLTVLTMCYAVGGISGGHFNPAVSLGLVVAGRLPASHLVPYFVVQVAGAIVAATVLYIVASGKAGFELGSFAANGYGEHSPGGYSLMAGLITGAFGAPLDLPAQRAFFERHLAAWAPVFFEDLERAKAAWLYAPVGTLGRVFMGIEQTAFAMAN